MRTLLVVVRLPMRRPGGPGPGGGRVPPAPSPCVRAEPVRGAACPKTSWMNVPVHLGNGRKINIPVDAVIKPLGSDAANLPLFIEAKSAGDFANTNKRRKEEAVKMAQLRRTHGENVRFNLFLCGCFDTPYLGYEAAEGIDWVWEHRIDDLSQSGI